MNSSAARQASPRFDRDANVAMRTNYPGINDPLLSMKSSRTWMVEMILAVWKLHRFRPLSVGDLSAAWRNCGDRLICMVDSCSRIEGDSPQDLYGNPVDRDARTARSSTMACSRIRYRSVVKFQPGYQSSNFPFLPGMPCSWWKPEGYLTKHCRSGIRIRWPITQA